MKFDSLLQYFYDAKNGYYRHLAIVLGKNYLENSIDLVKLYLQVNNNPKVAYAFHPWVSGSKDRLLAFKRVINNHVTDIDYSSSEKYLGESFDLTILDSVDDFRPNYISRLVDLTRGGGLAMIYSDNIETSKLYKFSLTRNKVVKNLFENRFMNIANSSRGIILLDDNGIRFKPFSSSEISKPHKKNYDGKIPKSLYDLCLTDDQVKLIREFDFVLEKGKRILVVTAPRGRGKSAGVGLALSFYVKRTLSRPTSIVITSPSYYSSQAIIQFLEEGLKALKIKYREKISKEGKIMKITAGEVNIKWTSPDLAKDENGDLIIVDEAAALGIENLEYIRNSLEKIVFISTIHGYEGSGKAFIKYINSLDNTQIVKLDYPVRYSKGDPVEKFIYNVMLLDAEPEVYNDTQFKEITQEELFSNDKLLRQVYGILVSAHYRNSPDDLMFLGDMAYQRIFTLGYNAVAEVVEEGNLDDNTILHILNGEENEGNLIPQRIIKYLRIRNFGKLNGWRIMRIAVTPELQNQGLGSKLLSKVEEIALQKSIDWIGSSFVVDYKVLNFWIKNGFKPVYLASKKNEGLGGYSIIVMKALNENAEKFVVELGKLLKDKILRTSHQVYFNVNPRVLAKIIINTEFKKKIEIDNEYVGKIYAYINGKIPYNSAADAIHAIAEKYFYDMSFKLSEEEISAIIARTFQGKSWFHSGKMLGVNNQKVEDLLRSGIEKIIKKYFGQEEKDYVEL
ncbi:GNAT family N-acetyltransferase [Acidianus sp. HS-5]|uniref:tRNA(Met) cytidine acetyltransferase TmcA n=1 Tax=Acidianus sp. HS-5 TaxID=2886040 RepID=UPI001F021BC3|nr:GNAT family N-acetyltransferase [Acidianus sp. HS-5]BDC19012.1 tRNA(Met) cytidine acetyltransferase [Acidianus sp. HS-5]